MTLIWKYRLDPDSINRALLEMPRVREVLAVGLQRGDLVLWAAVDPGSDLERAVFWVADTGQARPDGAHLGTVQTPGGLVWHVFGARAGTGGAP